MEGLRKTPLHGMYQKYGGKVIDFSGWALPVQFEGIIPEHKAVRHAAGIFDVSHMGEILVTGQDALSYLERILCLNVSSLSDGQIGYGMMLNDNGGCVDDVLVYRYDEYRYMVVINAANRYKDYQWMQMHSIGYEVDIQDISDTLSQIALQGPISEKIMDRVCSSASGIKFFRFQDHCVMGGKKCMVSRTGYTGEDGFEMYTRPEDAEEIFDLFMQIGGDMGLKPAGLGCRDTLRFEACLPLYGNELNEDITPLEAGLGKFVSMDKESFIGREALQDQLEKGLNRRLTGFSMVDRGVPRGGYDIFRESNRIGYVTTGYYSPTLEQSIGLGLIDTGYAASKMDIEIMIRGKSHRAVTRETPFYRKQYKK